MNCFAGLADVAALLWAEVDSTDPTQVRVLGDGVFSPLTLGALQAALSVSGRTISAVTWIGALLLLTVNSAFVAGDAPTLTLTARSVDPLRTYDGIDFTPAVLSIGNNIGADLAVTIAEAQSGFSTVSAGLYTSTVAGALALTGQRIPAGCSGGIQCDLASATNRGSVIALTTAYEAAALVLMEYAATISDNNPYPLVRAANASSYSSAGYNMTVGSTDTKMRIRRDVAARTISLETFTSAAWVSRYVYPIYYDGELFPVVGLNVLSKQLLNPTALSALSA